jgi:hypothetical protein
MARLAAISICALLLSGCAIPTISTDFDPSYRRMHARTGTRIQGTNDLPRSWQDVPHNLRYADQRWLRDIIDEQRQLVPTAPRGCSPGSRCTGR